MAAGAALGRVVVAPGQHGLDGAALAQRMKTGGIMIAITAELRAQPGKQAAVEKALREMVQVASEKYPTLPGYSLLQSEDDPLQFVMHAEFTSVEARMPDHQTEELMLM